MNLRDFISAIGDAEAAKLFRVKKRTVQSWRLQTRTPRPAQAAVIVTKTATHQLGPVTYAGIYGRSVA